MFLMEYVLPIIVVVGFLLVFYFLSKDSLDVHGSDGVPDEPSPPRIREDVVDAPPIEMPTAPPKPLKEMTKKELIGLAKERGVKINPRMRKDQIVKKLK